MANISEGHFLSRATSVLIKMLQHSIICNNEGLRREKVLTDILTEMQIFILVKWYLVIIYLPIPQPCLGQYEWLDTPSC